jgi:hypothetical protein
VTFGVDLGYDFITDVLELRLTTSRPMKRSDWWSIGYAIAEGAASDLAIKREDIDVAVRLATDGGYSAFLVDTVPGGAGHVIRIHEHLPSVMRKALERMANCRCEETTSCYECLRTFGNQRIHSQLSRRAAKSFLERALRPERRTSAPAHPESDLLLLISDTGLREIIERIVTDGIELPEIGYEIADGRGAVLGELEVAWPSREIGISMSVMDGEMPAGWQIWTAADVALSPEALARALRSA